MQITNENFEEVINSNKTVLIKVGAEWCGPCRMLKPVIEEIAKEFEGRAIVAEADADECDAIVDKFKIRGVPTILIFHNGMPVSRMVGAKSKDEIENELRGAM